VARLGGRIIPAAAALSFGTNTRPSTDWQIMRDVIEQLNDLDRRMDQIRGFL
jgi:hypothetical protein